MNWLPQAERLGIPNATHGMQSMNPVAVAWWAFAGMALSVLAAVGGAVVGAGPELTWWRAPSRVPPEGRVAVVPQPA